LTGIAHAVGPAFRCTVTEGTIGRTPVSLKGTPAATMGTPNIMSKEGFDLSEQCGRGKNRQARQRSV